MSTDIPKVGDAATFTIYSDSHACTVVAVSTSGKLVTLQRDKATLLNGAASGASDALEFTPGGFAGHTTGGQRYSYERDPEGTTYKVSRRVLKSGRIVWKQTGHDTKSPGCSASFGTRSEHYDFNY